MEPIIDDMLDGYEKGRLSRRALVQGLTALAMAAAATPSAIRGAKAAEEAASPLKATNVDHVSILTKDLQGSIDFYKSVFGFNELSADKEHKIMRMGPGKKIILSLRQQEPYGKVDHFGFRVEGFRENQAAATSFLKSKGLEPKTDWEFGYHFLDPNGVVVQLV
jgi:catechol 2,3-dioxygenase-like lactoylglutathione lyase family enzyme